MDKPLLFYHKTLAMWKNLNWFHWSRDELLFKRLIWFYLKGNFFTNCILLNTNACLPLLLVPAKRTTAIRTVEVRVQYLHWLITVCACTTIPSCSDLRVFLSAIPFSSVVAHKWLTARYILCGAAITSPSIVIENWLIAWDILRQSSSIVLEKRLIVARDVLREFSTIAFKKWLIRRGASGIPTETVGPSLRDALSWLIVIFKWLHDNEERVTLLTF